MVPEAWTSTDFSLFSLPTGHRLKFVFLFDALTLYEATRNSLEIE
jgi:hypothetical protein